MKAYQRIIREKEEELGITSLFSKEFVGLKLKDSIVTQVSIKFATPYILRYEWLGKMPGFSEYAFGHFFGYDCGGVLVLGHTTGSPVAFSKRFPNDKVIQLQRGVNLWWTPKNSASYFISKVVKWLKQNTNYTIITATADEEAGEIGTIYQALNWKYLGCRKHGHPVFIVDNKEVHPKSLYDKHGTSSVEAMKKQYGDRLVIKNRVFKHRYIYPINTRTKLDSLPYPKRLDQNQEVS
jgi:hypothetical protein